MKLIGICNRLILVILSLISLYACKEKETPGFDFILDMVHHNLGEGETASMFTNPHFLKSRGYNGMVAQWYVNCAITYDDFEKGIVPFDSKERAWIDGRADDIHQKLKECSQSGIDVFAFTDVFVAPKSIWDKYGHEMGTEEHNFHGYGGSVTNVRSPNIQYSKVQELMKAQIAGIFETFPSLDGLVIRFGETYLHDTPYHFGGKPVRQGDEGINDHVVLLNILREEVCVKRNKKLLYRTWDFGWFHTQPEVYQAITDFIEPHPNLFFSIKHTQGDFHRNFRFNPTLGLGKHAQVVEVQCQREYEGKGAHPNYIAKGVIEGFQEYAGQPGIKSLQALKSSKNFRGVWTWSRGGGWKGPYIKNEFWCELNAFVLSGWANNPARTEKEIFEQFTREKDLSDKDTEKLYNIALMSDTAVLIGRSSRITDINPFWIRDQFMGGLSTDGVDMHSGEAWGSLNSTFDQIVEQEIVDAVLDEKRRSVEIWKRMQKLSRDISTGSDKLRNQIRVSTTYGRIKYDIIYNAWVVMLKGYEGDKTGDYMHDIMQTAIENYDRLWEEFESLRNNEPQCATIYLPYGFVNNEDTKHSDQGMKTTVDKYREIIGHCNE
jgi:hypothetical protein